MCSHYYYAFRGDTSTCLLNRHLETDNMSNENNLKNISKTCICFLRLLVNTDGWYGYVSLYDGKIDEKGYSKDSSVFFIYIGHVKRISKTVYNSTRDREFPS